MEARKTDAHGPCTVHRTTHTPRERTNTTSSIQTPVRHALRTLCSMQSPAACLQKRETLIPDATHHTQTPLVRPATGRQQATAATACSAPHALQSHALRRTGYGARRARPDAQGRSAGLCLTYAATPSSPDTRRWRRPRPTAYAGLLPTVTTHACARTAGTRLARKGISGAPQTLHSVPGTRA